MQTAQSWARTQLTYKFPEEYRKFYLEEKGDTIGSNSKFQNKAKTRLVRAHWDEYRKLYDKAVAIGYPRNHKAYMLEGST